MKMMQKDRMSLIKSSGKWRRKVEKARLKVVVDKYVSLRSRHLRLIAVVFLPLV